MTMWARLAATTLCLILSVSAFACAKREPAPLFSKGLFPLVMRDSDFPRHPNTGAAMRSSADCAPCHKTAYLNWNHSRHRVALTNELYRESHEREPSPWCVNCHAPLRLIGSESKPYREEEGVSCLVCHVRGGKILVKKEPASVPAQTYGILAHGSAEKTASVPPQTYGILAHSYLTDERLGDERFCEGCHEFNFPTAATAMRDGHALHFTAQPMQSTVSEYRNSAFYGSVTCSGCHLFAYSEASHSFPGGHAVDRLKKDLHVEVSRLSPAQISVRISASGIGHSFPTGDLFRTLRVRIIDPGSKVAEDIELRHYFEPIAGAATSTTLPLKRRVREETLPAPQFDYISMREYTLAWPASSQQVVIELYMDYLNQMNTMTTRLPASLTRPLIKRETHHLPRAGGNDAKG